LVRSYLSDQYSVCGKRPLAIAVMNAELPLFKNGEHNSESTSTIDRVITPLICLKNSLSLFRYVRALGAFYMRMTGSSLDCYKYLEPLLNDYRKIRVQNRDGGKQFTFTDSNRIKIKRSGWSLWLSTESRQPRRSDVSSEGGQCFGNVLLRGSRN